MSTSLEIAQHNPVTEPSNDPRSLREDSLRDPLAPSEGGDADAVQLANPPDHGAALAAHEAAHAAQAASGGSSTGKY